MGTYLNPGNQAFQIAINTTIYVDKTEMLLYLNSVVQTDQRYVCVTRPRRFGKSMAADMICAYYDREADSQELFEQCKIAVKDSAEDDLAGWDQYLGKFNVIYLVMTDFINSERNAAEGIRIIKKRVLDELNEMYD